MKKQLRFLFQPLHGARKSIRILSLSALVLQLCLPSSSANATESGSRNSISSTSQQQKKTVTGIVTDENGEVLPGVAVVVKGSTVGIVTDFDGKYTLSNLDPSTTLVFSFVGMQTQEIEVGNQSSLDVVMRNDAIGLDVVVAIGYGTTTKRKAVGAVSTMESEQLEETPFANIGNAIQGQVPGLLVQNQGGGPGSMPSISIRGGGSPLYVIDGVITDEADFNTINSSDIEAVSFLKDASATAVYGSRGGNGIVLVTTKRGSKGSMKVNYSFNYQLSEPTTLPEMMNSYDFAKLQNDAAYYDGSAPVYDEETLEKIRTQSDPNVYPNNNWPELCLNDFATEQRHNLSLNGGDEKSKYFVSLGYLDQTGILKDRDAVTYNRFNIRSNLSTNFDKIGLNVGINVNASIDNYREPSESMYSIWRAVNQNTNPLYRAYNPDGTLAGGGNGDHPLAISSYDAGYHKKRSKFINTQAFANWTVPGIKGLKLGVMANYRDGDGWEKTWDEKVPLYMEDGSVMSQTPASLAASSYYSTRLYLESSLTYSRTFGKHGIEGTFVYNQTETSREKISASRWNYESAAVDQLFAGPANAQSNGGSESEGANSGYVFRAKYDYNYKYILEFSGRYDGNDNFVDGKRWGFFPATSLAWNISEENFMQGLNDKNIVNSLKLRFSYGETGVTKGVARFGYLPVYNLEPNAYTIGNTLRNGYSEGPLTDPSNFSWYQRTSLNYGLDFSTMNNKLSGTAEYFMYRTTGYLQSRKDIYTQPLGKDLPQSNSNSAHRRAGVELALRYKGSINDFKYQVGVNYSYFDQLWEQLDTEDEATLQNPYTRLTHRTDYWEGGAVYQNNGLYQNNEEILNNPRLLGSNATQAGDIVFKDLNSDGKIDEQDKRMVGKPSTPHSTYGIDFRMEYKGWYANGLFQGSGDRYLGFDNFMIVESKRRTYEYQLDYWTPENRNSLYPRVSEKNNPNGGNNNNEDNPSDFYLKNARYFRLKNLQVGYDMKKTVLRDVDWLESCRVFVNGTNLFTISPVMDYFDPEQVVTSSKGTAGFGYPVQRTYSFGVNVGF